MSISTESWLVALRKKAINISTKIHQRHYPTSGIHLKAHQRTLTPLTVNNTFRSNQFPSGPVYTKKTQNIVDIQELFENKNTLQNYEGKRATYTTQNDRGGTLAVPMVGVGS